MSRGPTRKEQNLANKNRRQELESATPSQDAVKAFKSKPYQIHDVPSYLKSRYGAKGEID